MSEQIFGKDYPDFQEFGEPPCASSYPDAFFSDDPLEGAIARRGTYSMEREAKITCFSCEYRQRCLEYALKNPDVQGIWGGTNENQRKRIRLGLPVDIKVPESRHR
jgi:WhiB family redox-sensing transcriptional regulator